MASTPEVSRRVAVTQVLIRFVVRMLILSVFAAYGSQGFAKTFAALLVIAVCHCVAVGGFRREAVMGPLPTHYDEAAAYAVIAQLTYWLA